MRERPEWVRDHVPLSLVFVALLIAILVLPSPMAVKVPDLNPQPEYAPVPPSEDDDPPPLEGNVHALGLGKNGHGTVKGGAGGGALVGPSGPIGRVLGKGVSPSTKRCVGVPPRQTEDPTSPPCVGYFAGDNFGVTSGGVTADEIRIVFYVDSKYTDVGTSRGQEPRPVQEYVDLFTPPGRDDHIIVRSLRAWQRYFNERFQTYGRAVHFFVYFSSFDTTPEHRAADAADNFAKVRPFAVVTDAGDNERAYVETMANRGVLNFGSFSGRSQEFFRRFPRFVWGYDPTVEYQAHTFGTYVCRKVVGHPTVLSGNAFENGQERKLGLWRTDDDAWPGLQLTARLVAEEVRGCGGTIAAEATFPRCCIHQGADPGSAREAMREFRDQGITTILWPGGVEGNAAPAAAAIGYFPEWVLLGDGFNDTNGSVIGAAQSGSFDHHAVIVTPTVVNPARPQQQCGQAVREADPEFPINDLYWPCKQYESLFQLFVGIQVAGPRLSPESIDRGFHAIPPHRSRSPRAPACFYGVDDYTCVKDAQVEMWDARGRTDDRPTPGCWTLIESGRRYLPGTWPAGNIDAQGLPADQCNQF